MEKINLLDLDNDALNIIGDYVKADNIERIKEEENKTKKWRYLNLLMKK